MFQLQTKASAVQDKLSRQHKISVISIVKALLAGYTSPDRKRIKKKYKRNLTKTLQLFIIQLWFRDPAILATPISPKYYTQSRRPNYWPAYLTAKTVKEAIAILKWFAMIDEVIGNRRLDVNGQIKNKTLHPFNTPGFITIIKPRSHHFPIPTPKAIPEDCAVIKIGGSKQPAPLRYREEINKLNNYLQENVRISYKSQSISYRRIFRNNTNTHGRLYALWMTSRKRERSQILPTGWVETDYPGFNPGFVHNINRAHTSPHKIISNRSGVTMYDNFLTCIKLQEAYRPIIKRSVLICMSTNNYDTALLAVRKILSVTGHATSTYKTDQLKSQALHSKWCLKNNNPVSTDLRHWHPEDFLADLIDHFSTIQHTFFKGLSQIISLHESNIILHVSEKLMQANIEFLPFHDAIYSHINNAASVRSIMTSVYQSYIRSLVKNSDKLNPITVFPFILYS